MLVENVSQRAFSVVDKSGVAVTFKRRQTMEIDDKQAKSLMSMYPRELLDMEQKVKDAKAAVKKAEAATKPKAKVKATGNAEVS